MLREAPYAHLLKLMIAVRATRVVQDWLVHVGCREVDPHLGLFGANCVRQREVVEMVPGVFV